MICNDLIIIKEKVYQTVFFKLKKREISLIYNSVNNFYVRA